MHKKTTSKTFKTFKTKMDVVVSGIGVVSALGIGVEANIGKLKKGLSGIAPYPAILATRHKLPVGEIPFSNRELAQRLGFKTARNLSRTSLLGILAAREAIEDAGIEDTDSLGLVSSTTVGGMDSTENFYGSLIEGNDASFYKLRFHDCFTSTKAITDYCHINGYVTTLSTACSSAANAIISGVRLLRHGIVEKVLVGGTDALSLFTLNGFNSLKILDTERCRPFDANRGGLNLGEGAGYLVLERAEDAKKCYCKISGFANNNDAFHQTASSNEGEGAFLAMQGALEKAGISADEIDYLNVHGTGTGNNDLSEAAAMKRVFAKKMPLFSSTKAFTGHALAAAGGIEAVYSVLSAKYGYIYPSLNFTTTDSEIALVPCKEFTTKPGIRHIMSNSLGFGGNCTTIIFSAIR